MTKCSDPGRMLRNSMSKLSWKPRWSDCCTMQVDDDAGASFTYLQIASVRLDFSAGCRPSAATRCCSSIVRLLNQSVQAPLVLIRPFLTAVTRFSVRRQRPAPQSRHQNDQLESPCCLHCCALPGGTCGCTHRHAEQLAAQRLSCISNQRITACAHAVGRCPVRHSHHSCDF